MLWLLSRGGTAWSGLVKLVRRVWICLRGVVQPGRRASERGGSHETRGRVTLMIVGADFWRVVEGSIPPPKLVSVGASFYRCDRMVRAIQAGPTRVDMCGRRGEARKASFANGVLTRDVGRSHLDGGRAGFLGVIHGQYGLPQIWSMMWPLSTDGTVWTVLFKLVVLGRCL